MLRIKVGIADDHPVVTLGVETELRKYQGIEVEFVCWDIYTLFKNLSTFRIDVLVCDFEFADDPMPDGLQLVSRIARMYPQVKLLLLSSHTSPAVVSAVINLGASGFIGKNRSEFANLSRVVREVNAGQLSVPDSVAKDLLQTTLKRMTATPLQLSDKEMTVARLTASGFSLQEIAARLKRSPKTISNQKISAMRKLGVRNDAELTSVLHDLKYQAPCETSHSSN
jgi:two-component system capsular synthesis response regulator RcsB